MRTFFLILSLLTTSLFSANKEDGSLKKLVQNTGDFGFSLYNVLNKNAETNGVFSPYSTFSCMAMVYYGARGDTQLEMKKALNLTLARPDLPKTASLLSKFLTTQVGESYSLETASGMWLDRDTFVLADFHHALEDGFQAKIQSLDFSNPEKATSIINEWTSNQTHQKIPELLQKNDVDGSTRLVLTNALYFKGNFQRPFDPKLTKVGPFHSPQEAVQAQMMEQTAFFPYFENDSFQLIALPFQKTKEKSAIATLILLPKKGIALKDLEQGLSFALLQKWIGQLDSKNIAITLPKFSVDSRFELNAPLKELGMQKAFTDQADFSGIDGMRDLYLSKVVHAALFVLDEFGVTAAAATAASINVTAAPPQYPPISFVADHPFLFFLVDLQTKLPLFIGKVVDPTVK